MRNAGFIKKKNYIKSIYIIYTHINDKPDQNNFLKNPRHKILITF